MYSNILQIFAVIVCTCFRLLRKSSSCIIFHVNRMNYERLSLRLRVVCWLFSTKYRCIIQHTLFIFYLITKSAGIIVRDQSIKKKNNLKLLWRILFNDSYVEVHIDSLNVLKEVAMVSIRRVILFLLPTKLHWR